MNKNIIFVVLIIVIALVMAIMFMGNDVDNSVSEQVATDQVEGVVEEQNGLDIVEEMTTSGLSRLEVTYEHTNPGEYSEVYVSLTDQASPGEDVTVTLFNAAGEENTRVVTADENGDIYETFRIYQYGMYNARAVPAVSGTQFNSGVEVK